MRLFLAAALAFGLTGCGSSDFFGESTPSTPAPAPASPGDTTASAEQPSGMPAQAAAAVPDVHCTSLAKQRAIDAAYEGEDPDTQRAVYDRSYTDCMAWDAKHRS